jgi:hypothetical protein
MKRYFLFVCIIGLLTVSCNKDNDPGNDNGNDNDYDCKWCGTYHYIADVYTWTGPDNVQTTYEFHGDLQVSCIKGKEEVFMALLPDSAMTWQCTVAEDGKLTLVKSNQSYRSFQGRFIVPDSLDFECAYFSPGSGIEWHFRCQR